LATEIELKLSVQEAHDQDVLKKVKKCLSSLTLNNEIHSNELVNIYFDTSDLQLNMLKMALRVRKKGSRYIQTLKTKGQSVNGLSQRGEWEWSLSGPHLDVQLLKQCEAWPASINTEVLMAVFETNFTRHQIEFEWQASRIELALDQGSILTQGRVEKINEIELELLSGNANDLRLLCAALQEEISLVPSDISKAERAYQLFLKQEGK